MAAEVNDDDILSDEEREKRLIEVFKEHGYKVEFFGEGNPNRGPFKIQVSGFVEIIASSIDEARELCYQQITDGKVKIEDPLID